MVLCVKHSLPTAGVSVICLIAGVVVTEVMAGWRDQSVGIRINRVSGPGNISAAKVRTNTAIAPTIVGIDLLKAVSASSV